MRRSHRLTLLLVLLILGLASGLHPFRTQARPVLTSLHLTLGNPSNAVPDPAFPANYLIDRAQNAMAYQRDAGIPAWVSWHLKAADIGGAGRGNFAADTSLPAGWYQVQPGDYTNSGYDRGHMTPSGDRTSSRAANDETFLMTNIIPQAPDNNQGPWASLENASRAMLSSGSNELYIISGGFGSQGTLAGGTLQIPAVTWKVIVVLPVGEDDASRVTTSTRVIGIWMPNVQGIRSTPWESYRVSVDSIEAQTGYDFLSLVPESIQAVVEAQVDGGGPGSTATPPAPSLTPTSTPTGTLSTPTPTVTGPTSTATSTLPPSAAGVVISQVYGGGGNAGALTSHDYIELFNVGTSPVALTGWSVQYAASSGTSWQKTDLLAQTLQPGQYLLVQEGSGGTCPSPCVPLPTPDVTGSIAMSGTTGKVVLSTAAVLLSGACPSGMSIRDTVGYGAAGCFEGIGSAPALSSTTAARRVGNGCVDTDQNAADFMTAAPAPRTSTAPFGTCQPVATPTATIDPTATTPPITPTGTPTATVSPVASPTAVLAEWIVSLPLIMQ